MPAFTTGVYIDPQTGLPVPYMPNLGPISDVKDTDLKKVLGGTDTKLPTVLNGPAAAPYQPSVTSGQYSAREVGQGLNPKTAIGGTFNADDISRYIRLGGGQIQDASPQNVRLREDLLNQMRGTGFENRKLDIEQQKTNAVDINTPRKLYDAAVTQSYAQYPDLDEKKRQEGFTALRNTLGLPHPGGTVQSPPPVAPPKDDEVMKLAEIPKRDAQGKIINEPNPSGRGERVATTNRPIGETIQAMAGKDPAKWIDEHFEEMNKALGTQYGDTLMTQWLTTRRNPVTADLFGRPSAEDNLREAYFKAAQKRGINPDFHYRFMGIPINPVRWF